MFGFPKWSHGDSLCTCLWSGLGSIPIKKKKQNNFFMASMALGLTSPHKNVGANFQNFNGESLGKKGSEDWNRPPHLMPWPRLCGHLKLHIHLALYTVGLTLPVNLCWDLLEDILMWAVCLLFRELRRLKTEEPTAASLKKKSSQNCR